MSSKRSLLTILICSVYFFSFSQFTTGNLVVLQAGDGALPLANTGNRIVLREFTPVGVPAFSVAITSSVEPLIISGSATSEGMLSCGPNGKYLTFGGYATTLPYNSSVSAATAANLNRGIGRVNAWGTYSRVATNASFFSGTNIRAAASDGIGNYWAGGGSSGTTYFGINSVSVAVQNSINNTRYVSPSGNGLYFSTGSGTQGIYRVGTGLPVIAGQSVSLTINTSSTGTGAASPFAFYFNAAQTICYVADDRSFVNGGGVQKWSYANGAWSFLYNLNVGGSSGARGVVVDFSGSSPLVYATTDETSANRLVAIDDAGAASTATTLATAAANTIFRGLAFSPSCAEPIVNSISSGAVCAGKTFTLNPTVVGQAPISYTWTGPGSFSVTMQNPVITATGNEVYSLTVSNSCGSVSATHSVMVNPVPVITLNSNPGVMCPGGTVNLVAGGAATYTWSTGASTTILVASPAITTNYTVTGESAVGCISTKTTAIVVTNSISLSVNPVTICPGNTATLTAMGANSFTWLPGFSNLQTILDAPLISFVYTVVGTAPGCSAGATTTVQITVSSLPTITVNSASVCIGGTVTLAASGGMNYAWSNSASGPVIFVTPTISTIYTVTGLSAEGCSSTAEASVSLFANPVVSLSVPETTVCENAASLTFTGSPSGGFFLGAGMNSDQFIPSLATTGTFEISYKYTDGNNCSATDVKTVTVISCTFVSIEDLTNPQSWSVYPVPARNELSIISENSTGSILLEIYDCSGIRLQELRCSSGTTVLDISGYVPGLYFIRTGSRLLKFVKD